MCHYYFKNLDSPTQYNLDQHLRQQGFKRTKNSSNADFSDANLTMPEKLAEVLEFKHLLAHLVKKHCPEVMPLTYCVDDFNYPEVLETIRLRHYQTDHQTADQVENLVWIVKPALLNNGKEIKIYSRLSELKAHFDNPKRLGGDHVIQQYILHPHVLKDRKYSFRMFVIMTNYAGAYLYHDGYFNVGVAPYSAQTNFTDLNCHLTNEHLGDEQPNVLQIPTQRCDNFDKIYAQMKTIVTKIINGFNEVAAPYQQQSDLKILDFFGFDFMLDESLRVWLLEINHRPCFPKAAEHILQKHLYHQFWRDVIRDFIIPICEHGKEVGLTRRRFDHIQC